jgi:hypothetical protein
MVKVRASGPETTRPSTDRPRRKNGQKTAPSNKDLPHGVHDKDHWHRKFIPTFLWWVAKHSDPWNLDDNDVVIALQQIWDVIYPNIEYTVEQKGAVVAVVTYNIA